MNRTNDSARNHPVRSRREALGLLGVSAALLGAAALSRPAFAADDEVLTEALVLRDPEIPAAGNVDGDITIVEWFDYNCPYCRKIDPELRQVIQDDGKVRLVLKDWPILGPVSKVASRMALAAKYQDKFMAAHEAMIGVSSKLTEPRLAELLSGAGIDMDRLKRDPRDQCQGDRRHPRPQQRSGAGVRLQGHAVLYRRKIPRARRPDHGGIRTCDRRRPQGQGRQGLNIAFSSEVDAGSREETRQKKISTKKKGAFVRDEGALIVAASGAAITSTKS